MKILLSVDDLIGAIKKYNPQTNSSLIEKAYQFGLKAHAGQMRKSGEPFFAPSSSCKNTFRAKTR